MLDMNGTKGKNVYEFDFVIVNYTHQYIMNIEVKKWLGKIQNKDIDIGKEVREQLEKREKMIEDWFSTDLKGVWQVLTYFRNAIIIIICFPDFSPKKITFS